MSLISIRDWLNFLFEAGILAILIVEYWYDKTIEESKKMKRKVTKGKVRVVIDKEGNVRIAESPKELDVQIDHEGS